MSEMVGNTPVGGGAPPAGTFTAVAGIASASSGTSIPAGAEGPVWQPWVTVQSQALSTFKTQINAGLGEYGRAMGAAQRILDGAIQLAAAQTGPLQAAAWAAYTKYMTEVEQVNAAIMGPAIDAYNAAVARAHTQLWSNLTPAERSYARVVADASWTNGLANGNAKLS